MTEEAKLRCFNCNQFVRILGHEICYKCSWQIAANNLKEALQKLERPEAIKWLEVNQYLKPE